MIALFEIKQDYNGLSRVLTQFKLETNRIGFPLKVQEP